MYLYYYLNEEGRRVYTLKKEPIFRRATDHQATLRLAAHPKAGKRQPLAFEPTDFRRKVRLLNEAKFWYFAFAWGAFVCTVLQLSNARPPYKPEAVAIDEDDDG
uniref:Nucleolar protein 10 n=1 Tax=Trichuris muris TaxID=70415 RepID=A0A5S6QXT9_TRIMR